MKWKNKAKRRAAALAALIGLALSGGAAHAMPTGGHVIAGTITGCTGDELANPASGVHIISEGSAILNWDTFSMAKGEQMFFEIKGDFLLSKVVGTEASYLDGLIKAQGNTLYLVNPNGITVGPNGTFTADSIVLSTLLPNDDQNPLTGGFHTDPDRGARQIVVNKGAGINVDALLVLSNAVEIADGVTIHSHTSNPNDTLDGHAYIAADAAKYDANRGASLGDKSRHLALEPTYSQGNVLNFHGDYRYDNTGEAGTVKRSDAHGSVALELRGNTINLDSMKVEDKGSIYQMRVDAGASIVANKMELQDRYWERKNEGVIFQAPDIAIANESVWNLYNGFSVHGMNSVRVSNSVLGTSAGMGEISSESKLLLDAAVIASTAANSDPNGMDGRLFVFAKDLRMENNSSLAASSALAVGRIGDDATIRIKDSALLTTGKNATLRVTAGDTGKLDLQNAVLEHADATNNHPIVLSSGSRYIEGTKFLRGQDKAVSGVDPIETEPLDAQGNVVTANRATPLPEPQPEPEPQPQPQPEPQPTPNPGPGTNPQPTPGPGTNPMPNPDPGANPSSPVAPPALSLTGTDAENAAKGTAAMEAILARTGDAQAKADATAKAVTVLLAAEGTEREKAAVLAGMIASIDGSAATEAEKAALKETVYYAYTPVQAGADERDRELSKPLQKLGEGLAAGRGEEERPAQEESVTIEG